MLWAGDETGAVKKGVRLLTDTLAF